MTEPTLSPVIQRTELTHAAALKMLDAAVRQADRIGVPECLVIVDGRGRTIAALRMDNARFLSLETATAKAISAASSGVPTGGIPERFAPAVAAATSGQVTNLRGGLPICFDGKLAAAIGVGSGSPDQDLSVARAALAAIGADSMDNEE